MRNKQKSSILDGFQPRFRCFENSFCFLYLTNKSFQRFKNLSFGAVLKSIMHSSAEKVFRQKNQALLSDSKSESEYEDLDIKHLDLEQSDNERENPDLNSVNFEKKTEMFRKTFKIEKGKTSYRTR